MNSRANLAVQKKMNGYNCCQAIVCTYADIIGIDEKTLFKLTEGLGAGVCNLRQTCGAVLGMTIIASYLNSDGNLENPSSKESTYDLGLCLADNFIEQNKTTICEELRAGERNCNGFVLDCCYILEQILLKNKI